MNRRDHWETVYTTKRSDEVSWFQPRPGPSVTLVHTAAPGHGEGIIDVGGGDSLFVDALLDDGYRDLAVLDISAAALARAQDRLGPRGSHVTWIASDVTTFRPQRRWDVWHDRAVFHFLTDPADRMAYRQALLAALAPLGHVVLATFAPGGPTRCSGLDVVRYGPDDLQGFLGLDFTLMSGQESPHTTPSGTTQLFTYAHFQRGAG